jgi:hypothetical protein
MASRIAPQWTRAVLAAAVAALGPGLLLALGQAPADAAVCTPGISVGGDQTITVATDTGKGCPGRMFRVVGNGHTGIARWDIPGRSSAADPHANGRYPCGWEGRLGTRGAWTYHPGICG